MTKRFILGCLFAFAGAWLVASASNSDIRPFVKGSWQKILSAHHGKPFAVHFWGVTCGPCRVEMPQWGELLKQRRDLTLVVVNADFVPDDPKAVKSMLTTAGLERAENWIFDDPFAEQLQYEIDPKWRGELPVTMLIGADGTRTMISGPAEPANVIQWLDRQNKGKNQ